MSNTMVITIVNKGNAKHPRALIRDQNGWFWTPSGWTEDEDKGMLFYNSTDAGRKAQELLRAHFGNCPDTRYRAPVYIDLYTSQPVSLEQLQAWLHKSTKLYVDTSKHGNGPIDGTLGVVTIDWGGLEECHE
jgi:hypothetical protein